MSARLFVAALVACALSVIARAEEPAAREVAFHGYAKAIELKHGKTRAVLCPQAGGRVLEHEGRDRFVFVFLERRPLQLFGALRFALVSGPRLRAEKR